MLSGCDDSAPTTSSPVPDMAVSAEDAMVIDLAIATGLISSTPVPGYGTGYEQVSESDIEMWKQVFGQDFLTYSTADDAWRSQLGRRRLSHRRLQEYRRRLEGHDEWGAVYLALRLGRFADVYTKGHRYSVWDIVSDVGGLSSSAIGLIGFALALTEGMKHMFSTESTHQRNEDDMQRP